MKYKFSFLITLFVITFHAVNGFAAGREDRGGGGRSAARSQPAPRSEPRQATPQRNEPARVVRPQENRPQTTARTPSMSRVERAPKPSNERVLTVPSKNSPSTQKTGQTANPQNHAQANQLRQHLDQKMKQWNLDKQPTHATGDVAKVASKANATSTNHAVNHVRDRVRRDHPGHGHWFNDQFFGHHHYKPDYHYHDHGHRRPEWTNVNLWLGAGWLNPVYYGDGGYPLYYGDGGYPVNQQTTVNYSQTDVQVNNQVNNQVTVNPPSEASGNENEWLQLGVFVAGKDETEASFSNLFVELALSKSGYLSGTYYNATTDQTYGLEGVVDRESQQAAWKLSDNPNSPVMTAGIYDLTQDIVPILVHFQNNIEQPWVLVRLNE